MNTEQWLNDMTDDIVMQHGVSYDTARIMLFSWLSDLLKWSPKFYAMMDYLLND